MGQLTLIIGNKNYSSWSLRPWIFMKHFNISFIEKRIALFAETTDSELEPYFSDFKVPVLQDDDFNVWDSLAIMEYVSENYLEGRGWPSDIKARAMARSISAEMHSSFMALRNALPMNCRKHFPGFKITAEVQQDIKRISDLWSVCRDRFGSNSSQNNPWLFGEYSIADAMFAPVVLRLAGYDVKTNQLASEYISATLALPELQDWIEAGKAETEIIEMDEV